MIKQKYYFTIILTVVLTICYGQKTTNQFDSNGKRHGLWTKNYHKTKQKRYEGTFVHGKEVDTFNFYTLNKGKSVLSATKIFNTNDNTAKVTFYTSTKNIISKGKMNGKHYIGKWVYYHKNSKTIMIEEHYNEEGKLEGLRNVYYKNGIVAEQSQYKNGKLNGESKWFSEQNKLLKTMHFSNDQLQGKTVYYDADGNITSEGDYTNDEKKGLWAYYKNGKLTKKINHTTKEVFKF